ncbi:hypothetical protein IT411_00085 [Candidatus Peregrinibacteria bacterium]|nr:hypothetical protein [Candidatus Peregrinibacteria bacterium]
MASEQVLKKLLEAAKISSSFAGMKEEDIWAACQAYRDRSDEEVEAAIKRIDQKEVALKLAAEEHEKALQAKRDQLKVARMQEAEEREMDIGKAEKLLEELFKN